MKSSVRIVAGALLGMFLFANVAQAGGFGHGRSGYGGGYHHHGHGNGAAIALGVAGAVLGTAIIADAITRPRTVYVESPPAYYPPAPAYAPAPPSYTSRDYDEGYRAGVEDARRYPREQWSDSENVDYGLGR